MPRREKEYTRRTSFGPSIPVPETYIPHKDSLAEALLKAANLPVGNTTAEVKPDDTPIVIDYRRIKRSRGKHFRQY